MLTYQGEPPMKKHPLSRKEDQQPLHTQDGRTHSPLSQHILSRTCPHRRVNDLEEELPGSRVKHEDRAVDRLRGQVTIERLRKETHAGVN